MLKLGTSSQLSSSIGIFISQWLPFVFDIYSDTSSKIKRERKIQQEKRYVYSPLTILHFCRNILNMLLSEYESDKEHMRVTRNSAFPALHFNMITVTNQLISFLFFPLTSYWVGMIGFHRPEEHASGSCNCPHHLTNVIRPQLSSSFCIENA